MTKLKDQTFIVFGEDYARHPHALEHLFRPLFKDNTFIWVETIGLRTPKLSIYDFKRILEKLFNWSGGNKKVRELPADSNFTIVRPFMLPFMKWKLVRWFNKWNVLRNVKAVLNCEQPILITSVPNACDYVGEFNEKLKIYFCVDEFSLWPGLDYEFVRSLENKLIDKVDFTISTSEALSKSKKAIATITHGVEFDHFSLPEKSINKDNPKLCYFGLFDQRSNQKIIAQIAQHLPEATIEIIGPRVVEAPELKKYPNIVFKGKVAYSKLPETIKDIDVFILPYVRNELTENINPLKLKEYLSTGRPVVATALPEVAKLKNHLFLAENGEEFVKVIDGILENGYDGKSTQKYIRENETWQAKARELSRIILSRISD